MTFVEFTPAGIETKRAELNAMNKIQRTAQCNQIRYNLRAWVAHNFTLTDAQQDYLDNMDEIFLDEFSDQVATAVYYRLKINLYKEEDDRGTKVFETASTIQEQGPDEATGELTINVRYEI